jgi:hypothetical protein
MRWLIYHSEQGGARIRSAKGGRADIRADELLLDRGLDVLQLRSARNEGEDDVQRAGEARRRPRPLASAVLFLESCGNEEEVDSFRIVERD